MTTPNPFRPPADDTAASAQSTGTQSAGTQSAGTQDTSQRPDISAIVMIVLLCSPVVLGLAATMIRGLIIVLLR